MSKLFDRLVKSRKLTPDFLNPKYEQLEDPYKLPDMKKAVNRLKTALKNQEKILIYGDYDVDGVTASTVMEETLKLAGVNPKNIEIMLPDRFIDGYGMSPKLIDHAKTKNITLVITVDCGSRNHEIIEELNELKIDSIITDHHETAETLPEAIAVINPKRTDSKSENLKNLAGVGVAFKFAEALVKENLIKNGQEKWLLDLVLIGTVCDSMPLIGENHILGFYGLKVLQKTRRPGLKELIKVARVKNLHSETIGFAIGPRLNAAGRLETAELSLNLLRAANSPEAAALAEKLEVLNKKRKSEQNLATKEIDERGEKTEPVIIEVGDWHEGILGIVAGRLVDKYHKPAFVLARVENDILKGSGRSFGDFNLATALDFAKNSLISGGGHAAAAGVKLEQKNLYQFREQINAYYQSLNLKNQTKYLKVTPDLELDDLSEISLELLEELKQLEPYGQQNEEPLFRLKNIKITEIRKMGVDENHLRLDIEDHHGKTLKLIAFFARENWLNLDYDAKIEPIVKLIENEFNGIKSVEAQIVDLIF
ncbi:single-stranded-DNA-specific exonuclease RecJ [Candidatus Saccharibacteria bacterium]|nr:single-stranded-DNA-specific exonuclease RecJ [Candidatus Saccharibacteria bacterium]